MDDFGSIIKNFQILSDWESYIKENFERRSGLYSFVSIIEFRIEIDKRKYIYPRRIIFESGYIKAKKIINKIEKTTSYTKKVKTVERKIQIPFGYYKRENKYSGELINIMKDIFRGNTFEYCKFSNDILQIGDTPLFNIDSKIDWPSYVLFYFRNNSKDIIPIDNVQNENEDYIILKDISSESGMHYTYSEKLKLIDFVIFKIPYLKIIENRIKKENDGFEKLFFVLEYGDLSIFYNSKYDIKAKVLIKDIEKNVIFDDTVKIDFDKSKYQTLEVKPKIRSEIGFSLIDIYINNILVDKRSGYYIRSIKIDVKVK
ncbi:hypothetical protein [Flavobacterium sp.]|uniref:hypothetical protein n=1 Tax=Flavobacterium sp. TaxID=239 RepID=UPI002B4B5AC3|nr:hypothetical protein [Flavobacterium sp.]HLF52554.1 hypothetical protein [Flavobacterium sp.]